MPDAARLRLLRQRFDDAEVARHRLGVAIAAADADVASFLQTGDSAGAATARQQRDQLVAQRDQATRDAATMATEIETARDDFDPAVFPDLPARITALAADRPVALLPVRIETRFLPHNDAPPTHLWIRIYPDDVHVDTHEPELTAAEVAAAGAYWSAVADAAGDPAAIDAAWTRLAETYPPNRAEWIARLTRPGADGIPRLDDAPRKEGAWTRAPVARALPERFVALGYAGGRRVFTEWGAAVADRLIVGLEPQFDADATVERLGPPPPAQTELPIGPGMRWLVELDEAQRVGMAISVELSPELSEGLDRLVVLGVRWSDDPDDAAALLTAQLDSHRFTEGLEILRPGAATNNTADERSALTSARPRSDPFRTATIAGPDSVGAATATALGLDLGRVADVGGADRLDRSAAMHAAMWPATLGYYLEQLLLPLLSDRTIDRVHDHFVRYVRGHGPLPALRIGNQPYGLLPVMVPGRVRSAGEDISEALESILAAVRGFWTFASRSSPRLGRTDDAVGDLVEVLGLTPTSQSAEGRPVVGRHLVENLLRHGVTSPIPEAAMEAQRVLAEMLLRTVGVNDRTIRLASTASLDVRFPIRRPFVGRGRLSETEPAAFVAELFAALGHPDTLQRVSQLTRPASLLELLLRHAAVAAMGSVATALNLVTKGRPSRVLMEAEFVDVDAGDGVTVTPLRLIDRAVAGVTDGRTVAEVIAADDTPPLRPHLRPWNDFRRGLEALTTTPAAELHRLFVDGLDVLSHRLDAWCTSLATRRLEALRQVRPSGVHLGAYGFVEEVRPVAPESIATDASGQPVVQLAANHGYVHAPSLAHASTAAILRSGFLANGGSTTPALAVDLSSARMRRALDVIDGVRQGERLGAVLGYRIERALREAGRGEYIRPLRTTAPLVVDVAGVTDPLEAAIAGTVADGERLVELAAHGDLFGAPPRPFAADDPHRADVEAAIAAAADVVDALADLLLAETVHQLVRGDTASASAALAASDDGATPPDPAVARTPRTGVGVTHRVVLLFDPTAGPAPGWPTSARSRAEPGIDRWAGRLMGPPDGVRIDVRYREDGAEPTPMTFSLADVTVAAIDVITGLQPGTHGEASELDTRVLRHAATLHTGSVELVAPAPDDDERMPYAELLALAGAVARVIAHATPATGTDLAATDTGGAPGGIDAPALRQRTNLAETAFRQGAADFHAAVTAGDPVAIEAASVTLAAFGIPGSLAGDDATAAIVDARLAQLDDDSVAVDAPPDAIAARLSLIFGGTLRPTPAFVAANAGELTASRAQSTTLEAGDSMRAASWLGQVGLVRDGVERLTHTMLLAETVAGTDPGTQLRVLQLPHTDGDRWVAMELADDRVPTASIAIVVHDPDDVDFTAAVAGLVVDEWHEVVPRGSEISGVSFHYDQPDAVAPNAIVLAVPAGDAATWDLDTLEATVLETIELAKLRTVDTDDLQWVARFLPFLYFPDNLAGDTAAVDLLRMATREGN